MRLKTRKIIIISTSLAITAALMFGLTQSMLHKSFSNKTTDTASNDIKTADSTQKSAGDEQKQKIIDMLAKQGLDKNKLEGQSKSEDGATILGDSLPVRNFKTLADAESAYGDYLGLHNNLESLTDYNLVGVYLINNEFIQASFESTDGKKSITVKTSKKDTANKLIKVYNKGNYNKSVTIQSMDIAISGESSEKIQTMSLNTPGGRSYSIHTEFGLSETDATKLLNELVSNLILMGD